MTQKHTPGPWAYDAREGRIFYNDAEGAAVFPTIAWMETDNTDPTQAASDGALIAAAPDLLAEAHTQLRWLRHIRPQITAPDSVMLGFDQAEKALSAAIAKAEGR